MSNDDPRATILGCLGVMTGGMFLATTATDITALCVFRVITGLGIGGTLAAINAVAAEFSSARARNLSVSIMSIGYPAGAVLGGTIVTQLLKGHDWRAVFYFGCGITALFIPLVLWLIPESVPWLARKQPAGALEKINRTLKRMGHAAVEALPVLTPEVRSRSGRDIFGPALIATTLIVTANAGIVGMYAIFAHVFPTHVRASGTGFGIGVGRGGSVIGPPLAGRLFDQHYSLPTVAVVLALGTLTAAFVLSLLKLKPDQPASDFEAAPAVLPTATT